MDLKKIYLMGYVAGMNNSEFMGEPEFENWENTVFREWVESESPFYPVPEFEEEFDDV